MNAQNRVMFVDDEEGVRLSYDRYFSGHGFDVETAMNGQSAVTRLRESPADVVVADLRMPGMDGIQLLEWIHEEQPDTQFILLTGYGNDEVERRARELGAFEFLNKPISPNTLAAVVTAATILRPAPEVEEAAEVVLGEVAATESAEEVEEAEVVEVVAEDEVVRRSTMRRTLEVVGGLVAAPLLGLAFVVFLPVIGFGALFWVLGETVRDRFRSEEA